MDAHDRRTVLKAGIGGLIGAAALESGCATAPLTGPGGNGLDPAAAEAAIARIDERMAELERRKVQTPADLPDHLRASFEARAELGLKTMRSLYLSGAFQQLDEPVRYHPGVQERVRRMQGEMDDAVRGVTDHLDSLPPEERKRLQKYLAEHPDTVPDLGQRLGEVATEGGFRLSQRAHLRYTVNDVERGLRAQNPSLLIDRYVRHARALSARGPTERDFALQMDDPAFRQLKERAVACAQGWERIYASRPRSDLARLDELYPALDEGGGGGSPDEARGTVLTAGGWLLGIGAVTEGLGWIIFYASGAMTSGWGVVGIAMCLYIAPALLVIGAITLLVGFLMPTGSAEPAVRPPPPQQQPSASPL